MGPRSVLRPCSLLSGVRAAGLAAFIRSFVTRRKLVSGDSEGPEDDSGAVEGTNLEHMLSAWAGEEYAQAQASGGIRAYFNNCVRLTSTEFTVPYAVRRNILDFAVARYVFHHRHKELDVADATREATVDAFQYMLELRNSFSLVDSSQYRDRWR